MVAQGWRWEVQGFEKKEMRLRFKVSLVFCNYSERPFSLKNSKLEMFIHVFIPVKINHNLKP